MPDCVDRWSVAGVAVPLPAMWDPLLGTGAEVVGRSLAVRGGWSGPDIAGISAAVARVGMYAILLNIGLFVCWSLTSLCHSNGHIETMPAREINPFTALTRIRSQFLRTQ